MSNYWRKRYEAIEEGLYRLGDAHIEDIEQEYNKAIKELQRKIEVFYGRFANNNEVSINDAKKMLSAKELKELRWTLSEYIKFGKENALNGKWIKQLENASIRARIERLQMLELQVRQELETLAAYKEQGLTKLLGAEYKEGYYRSIYEVQKNTGMGTAFQTLPSQEVNNILSKAWAPDGKNFSSRIWTDKNQMINTLTSELTQGFIIGRSAEEMTQRISERMNVSKRNAMRLVRTESSYFANASFQASYKEMGIEQQIFVATLDTKTSATCREMDGKIIATSDVKPGINAPPLHAYCRSVMSPYFEGNVIERAARNKDGKTYSVPGDITYKKWYNEYVTAQETPEAIKDLEKLKSSGMPESDYTEYLSTINNHQNPSIKRLYSAHGDKIGAIKKSLRSGQYNPSSNSLEFSYPQHEGMNKYGTLAHEYGHFFDAKVNYQSIHFKEMEAVRNATGMNSVFPSVASSSDEFLGALRKDKKHIQTILTPEVRAELSVKNASHRVQDAIDGLFPKSTIRWGHGEAYYNRKYSNIEYIDKIAKTSGRKALQQAYTNMGFDVSNQSKVKVICRQYEAASEAWANIMSAEVLGGEELDYIKKYLPNSYEAMMNILKRMVE